VRNLVRTAPTKAGKDGSDFRIQEVTLDEYVRFSRRLVTPIYPADANLIVNLLDLHPEVYDPERAGKETLEILEAGTGHGGLTLTSVVRSMLGTHLFPSLSRKKKPRRQMRK
jgi:tRNA (adenine57-N1/adenine58-N1)-methyltransferase